MTEDVQEEAFASLQREEDRGLAASHRSGRGLNWSGGCTDPLVLRTQALLFTRLPAVVTVRDLRVFQTPAKRAEKITPGGGGNEINCT